MSADVSGHCPRTCLQKPHLSTHATAPLICPEKCIRFLGMGKREKQEKKEREKVGRDGPGPTWRAIRTPSFPPRIWAGFGDLRTARTYGDDYGGSGWRGLFYPCNLSARTYVLRVQLEIRSVCSSCLPDQQQPSEIRRQSCQPAGVGRVISC